MASQLACGASVPTGQPIPVVHKVVARGTGVVEFLPPLQRIEGADFYTDAAVHAQSVIDSELVEDVYLSRASSTFLHYLVGMGVDSDAPRRTLTHAQHARRAVFGNERYHSPSWRLAA